MIVRSSRHSSRLETRNKVTVDQQPFLSSGFVSSLQRVSSARSVALCALIAMCDRRCEDAVAGVVVVVVVLCFVRLTNICSKVRGYQLMYRSVKFLRACLSSGAYLCVFVHQ